MTGAGFLLGIASQSAFNFLHMIAEEDYSRPMILSVYDAALIKDDRRKVYIHLECIKYKQNSCVFTRRKFKAMPLRGY
jgi:hypothetical protein